MPFVEKQRHGGHTYLYLVKSVRTSPTHVRKVRVFLGRELPSPEKMREMLRQLERKLPPPYSVRWLDHSTVKRLEDLRTAMAVLRSLPGEILPKDFLVRFTYHTNAIEGNPLTLRQTALLLMDEVTPEGARAEHVIEALNSKDAWDYVRAYKGAIGKHFVN